MPAINHFSVNDDFWFHIKPHLVSFGFKWLPKNVHFTVVFDENERDVNFHVTKNTSDNLTKPQIKIFRIDRIFFNSDIEWAVFLLLNKFLVFVDIEELLNQSRDKLYFLPFDDLSGSEKIETKLIGDINTISKYKRNKTRMKLAGDVTATLKNFVSTEDMQSVIFENLAEVRSKSKITGDRGIIISGKNCISVIKINEEWYTFRTDLKPIDLLSTFVRLKDGKYLYWRVMRAIVAIKLARTYENVEHFDKPFRLIRKSQNKYYQLQSFS